MKCPNCSTQNPDSHNFCFHCGELLGDHCPRCGFPVERPVNFCGSCGLALSPRAQFLWRADQAPPFSREPRRDYEVRAEHGAAPAPDSVPSQTPLDQYIPRELRTKLEAARARNGMEGERRVVTMMFCDVKGSTEAAGQLDPEDWTEIINGAFEYMIRPVYKYEGTVARLMGDGILAFFGAPIAHEDDPQRAVLAGLEIVDGLAPYRDQIRARWNIEINVRVGINTGLVVVGAVGSDLRMEYTAMGDAINLAARMEQTAEPGTIQVALDTYRHVSQLFDFEDLGGIQVKGKAEPVQAYRALRRKASARRLRGIEGLEAEMVGRDQELQRLRAVFDNLARGIGRIVCLTGSAGLGKSRLIQELKRSQPPESPVSWYEVASLSYEAGDPYALFQQFVRRLAGTSVGEAPEQFWEKIGALIDLVPGGNRNRFERVFAALFGQADPSGQPLLEGELFKRELYAAMRAIWQTRFSSQPAAVVFDDLHWADPASIDLLLHLLPTVESCPIVLLCAFRPDRSAPSYQVKQTADTDFPHRYTGINLRPLSPEEGDELVNRLLSIADLPGGLRERIQERAAGNPFYVEEMVRTLIEKGAVVAEDREENGEVRRYWHGTTESAEIEIPDNLQGLLASRIDRLDDGARHIIQLASVIGRSFFQRVLAEIGRPDDMTIDQIDDEVGRLVRLEMIQESARVPDVEYRFRNPMTQEIAYQTILLKRRREFHRRVGEALERLFPDRQTELTQRLAFHFSEAQAANKALEYHIKAGDHAFRLFALDEALGSYDQAMEWADRAEISDAQLIHLYSRRGRTLELQMKSNEALAGYRALESLGEAMESDAVRLAGISAQAILYTVTRQDVEQSRKYSQMAYELARKIGDPFTEARTLWSRLLHYTWIDAEQALAYGNQGLAIARELAGSPDATNDERELLGLLLLDLTIPLIGAGQIPTARDYASEAKELFEQVGNLPMKSTAAQRQGLALRAEGRYTESEEAYGESTEMDLSIGNEGGLLGSSLGLFDIYPLVGDFEAFFNRLELLRPIFPNTGLPPEIIELYPMIAYFYLGAYEKIGQLAETMFAFRKEDVLIWPDLFLCYLARAEIELGDLTIAQRALAEVRSGSSAMNYMVPLAPMVPQVKSELALATGDWELALGYIDDFIGKVRADGMLNFLPEKLLIKGRILARGGRLEEACEAYKEVRALAVRQNARTILWQAAAELAEIELTRGNSKEAQGFFEDARAAIDFIAGHAGGEDLRASFLALPQVQTVISKTGG